MYFELVNPDKNNYKFWEIEDLKYSNPPKVVVRYGKIGNQGITKEFIYHNDNWGEKYMQKQIESKVKKGYVQKSKFNVFNIFSKPNVKKTSKPSTKPKQSIKKVSTQLKSKKICPHGKVLNPKTGRCVIDRSKPKPSIKKVTTPKSKPKPQSKSKKTCPQGKVLNPKTERCVIDKSKKETKKVLKIKKTPKVVKEESVKIPKGRILYDVKKQGVMLAHTFKDPKSGKIKTAPKSSTQAPNGWFLSEKYDGYRAIWNGQDFVSRNGNIFPSPPNFKKWLPNNVALDGELFMGRENFEKCGLFRKKEADCEAWSKANVTYQIFDSPTMTGMFEERTSKIQKLIKEQCKKYSGKCPLIMTKQVKVKNEADVYKHFDKLVSKGAEGVMLRAPNSPYEPKRSNYLLKVKQLFDAECKIIGYKQGSGKYANMLGAFECELVKNKKIKFTISGMDDSVRKNYKKTHPIGTIVTFTYMGLSERGVPRHPNYLRKRGKE